MQIDSVFLIESQYIKSLYPFSILHCGWELRLGSLKYYEQVQKLFSDARLIFNAREKHLKSFLARNRHDDQSIKKENILILNSGVLPEESFFEAIDKKYSEHSKNPGFSKSALFTYQGMPLAALITAEDIINPGQFDNVFLPKIFSEFNRLLPNIEIEQPNVINYLWDTLDIVGEQISNTFKFFENILTVSHLWRFP